MNDATLQSFKKIILVSTKSVDKRRPNHKRLFRNFLHISRNILRKIKQELGIGARNH